MGKLSVSMTDLNLHNIKFETFYSDSFNIYTFDFGLSDEPTLVIAALDYADMYINGKKIKFSNLEPNMSIFANGKYLTIKDITNIKKQRIIPFYTFDPYIEVNGLRIVGPCRVNVRIPKVAYKQVKLADLEIYFDDNIDMLELLDEYDFKSAK
jgi:hypothetical protein